MLTNFEMIYPGYAEMPDHDKEIIRKTVSGVEAVFGELAYDAPKLNFEVIKKAIDHSLRVVMNMGYDEVFVKNREMHLVEARQMAICACRIKFRNPLAFWGRAFERNHASILHNIREAENFISIDKNYKSLYKKFYGTFEQYLDNAGVCAKGETGLVVRQY